MRRLPSILVCFTLSQFTAPAAESAAVAPETPAFLVPGHEAEMSSLLELFRLHLDGAFTDCTLWDGWLPQATLWASAKKREQQRAAFLNRRMDSEGYVSMQQHRGMAHSDGWPFPAWQQSTGTGFHFSIHHEVWAIQNFALKALTSTDGWEITGAQAEGIDPVAGLRLKATGDAVSITTPAFRCGTIVAPFARLEWAARGLSPESQPKIQWLLEGETEWKPERHASFPPLHDADGLQYANVPLYRQPGYAGILTRYRITYDHAAGAQIDLKSIITAVDSRHPITNSLYLRGCADYFAWTRDTGFLTENMARMRKSLRFALEEFSVRQEKHVRVPWVGHDGRSGLLVQPDGEVLPRPGHGVGNNYWDLLPFGGRDAIATMYLCDALRQFAALERGIAAHPEWKVPRDDAFNAADLTTLADEMRTAFQKRFWNSGTGRFAGWIDADDHVRDFGFTFVNLEAIHYDLASPAQAQSIFTWLDGRREVEGDTSRGADIYHWRFAPRATTRRNIECYVWPWSAPDSIPWGDQVQDGGAVLGFSFHDLMARLKTNGPEDTWKRLREILAWFREVQTEGGYRAYYAKPGRGKLQGGGPPGGLGMDQEFLESVLVPQVMLYGFMGFQAGADGFALAPRLPKDWPSLTITRIRIHDHVIDVTAHQGGRVQITTQQGGHAPLRVTIKNRTATLPAGSGQATLELQNP